MRKPIKKETRKAVNDEEKTTDNDDYCPDYINQNKFKFKPKL